MKKRKHRQTKKAPQSNPPRLNGASALQQLEAAAATLGIDVSNGKGTEAVDVDAVIPRIRTFVDALKRAREQVERRAETLDSERSEVEAGQAAVEALRSEIEGARNALDEAREELRTRAQELAAREEAVQAREADADAGFVRRREEALRELSAAHDAVLARNRELSERAAARERAHLEELERQRNDHEDKLQKKRSEYETKLRSRIQELATKENELRAGERQLEQSLFDAQQAKADADDLKDHVEEYIEERTAERVAATASLLEQERRLNEELRKRTAELEQQLAARQAATRLLENMSPEAVRNRLDRLGARISELEDELADRPSQAEAEELRALREESTAWSHQRQSLLAEKGRLESRLERQLIEIDTLENLRDRNRALLENQRLLKAALDDLARDIDERLEQRSDRPAFPELLRMDDDPKLREEPTRLFPEDGPLDLEAFAKFIQNRIARGSEEGRPPLYYRAPDIRAFLGGLAMSQLHLLQGISGIGKSSLPRAFAEAVGGFCDTVSVQAGWRDRNDLFGYFNSFEKRYYELPFTQAVYKALLPKWENRIAIVLLDEMNLSHFEQYGADVLDVLERKEPSERRFELLPSASPGKTPAQMKDDRFLPLPSNVWFIGTANHDETTKDFADKTYDRSFVLELPGRPEAFTPRSTGSLPPISYAALIEAFDQAAERYTEEASQAWKWMDGHLRTPMEQRFQVGWGGRLESQMQRYVPVVRAAGGRLGEALDQVVTSRVLRKIKGRHDNLEEDLEHLLELLEGTWPDAEHKPEAAMKLLHHELRHGQG